jgi:hypothetical protein
MRRYVPQEDMSSTRKFVAQSHSSAARESSSVKLNQPSDCKIDCNTVVNLIQIDFETTERKMPIPDIIFTSSLSPSDAADSVVFVASKDDTKGSWPFLDQINAAAAVDASFLTAVNVVEAASVAGRRLVRSSLVVCGVLELTKNFHLQCPESSDTQQHHLCRCFPQRAR